MTFKWPFGLNLTNDYQNNIPKWFIDHDPMIEWVTDRQTDRQKDRRTDTDRQIDLDPMNLKWERETDRQTDRQTDRLNLQTLTCLGRFLRKRFNDIYEGKGTMVNHFFNNCQVLKGSPTIVKID